MSLPTNQTSANGSNPDVSVGAKEDTMENWGAEHGVGLARWHKLRAQWVSSERQSSKQQEDATSCSNGGVGGCEGESNVSPRARVGRDNTNGGVTVSRRVNINYVAQVLQEGDGKFKKPVPLSCVVEALSEIWEAEGLFD